jgi:hypothetical protein
LVTIFFHSIHPSLLRLPYWAFSKHVTSHHRPDSPFLAHAQPIVIFWVL